MHEVGVRVTQNFVKSAMRALSFGDAIPRLSECEDRRGRPSALSNAYLDQLAKIVKHYIRDGISLSQNTILSMAKTSIATSITQILLITRSGPRGSIDFSIAPALPLLCTIPRMP